MARYSVFKPLFGLSLLAAFTLLLAACMPVQPAAPAAAAPTDTPAASSSTTMTSTETMSTTTAMTSSESMSSTMPMTATETTTSSESMSGTMGATVMVYESPTLGKILTDDKGMTLYIFDKDVTDKSNCSGGCLKNWPAFMVQDEDAKVMGDGVTATFGVIERDDGTYQVTANGMPLYYYIKDKNPQDTTGQAVGDVWWVVGPDGNKISKQ